MVAFEAALELLGDQGWPIAIICSKDEFALQVYGAAANLGLRIPDDLSVVGFDDLELLSAVMRPALTTVRLPCHELGRLAALAAPPEPGIRKIPCSLMERASTRAV